MNADAIQLILDSAKPTLIEVDGRKYFDQDMTQVVPPMGAAVELTTLAGLVALHAQLPDAAKGTIFVHVKSETQVALLDKDVDDFGRRRIWAIVEYPRAIKYFAFGTWLPVETFIIEVQQFFQRVKIESQNEDGEFARDLDYVLKIASNVEAGLTRTNTDDGISQVVDVRKGIALKTAETLKPRVNLAPYRTFAEIDQPVAQFIFRVRDFSGQTQLALFEGDGGRWRLAAVKAIADWLKPKIETPIVT